MSRPAGIVTLEQVLDRVHARPLPAAGDLLGMSLDDLEAELAGLGVDVSADLVALEAVAAGVPRPPGTAGDLHTLDHAGLQELSVADVEAHLQHAGVDVEHWLTTAQQLIASAVPRRGPDTAACVPRRAAPSTARRPRRVPRALAASVAIAFVSGVTFFVVRDAFNPADPIALGDVPIASVTAADPAAGPGLAGDARPAPGESSEPLAQALEAFAVSSDQTTALLPPMPQSGRPAQPAAAPAAAPAPAPGIQKRQIRRSAEELTGARDTAPVPSPRATPAPAPRQRSNAAVRAPPAAGRADEEQQRRPLAKPRLRRPESSTVMREQGELPPHSGSAAEPDPRADIPPRVDAPRVARRAEHAAGQPRAAHAPARALVEGLSSGARLIGGTSLGKPDVEREVPAGVPVVAAIDDAIPGAPDRDALRALLSAEIGPGRARVWLSGDRVRELRYIRADATSIRIARDSQDELRPLASH